MRIAINAMSIRRNFGGIGVYARNLIKALAYIDRDNSYILLLNTENYYEFKVEQGNFENVVVRAPFKKYYIWEQFCLSFILKKRKIDVVHGPRFVLPLACRVKSVVTIHDLAFLLFPEFMPFNPIRYWDIFVKLSVRKADHIIAVSESTKRDIIRLFNIPDAKITVTHEACNDSFKRIEDECELKRISKKYDLPNRFILYVGTIEPRKNLIIVLEALHILREKYRLNLKLVIAGKKGWLYTDFFNAIKRLGLERNIVFTGYVSDEYLPGIYNLAELFVYPSKYEGFGLPLLEAMACGVPVIASNVSSIPEVLGDAGLLFDPYAPDQLADCIFQVLEDPLLRKKLISNGLKRKEAFSWQKTAEETLNIYKGVFWGCVT